MKINAMSLLFCIALAGSVLVQASQTQEKQKVLVIGAEYADDAKGDDSDSKDDDHDEEPPAVKNAEDPAKPKNDADEEEDEEEDEPEVFEIASPKSADDKRKLNKAKQKLAANLHEQSELERRMLHLGDASSSDAEIDLSIKLVSNETQSPAMANMLGHVWKEMRMFEVPVYTDHVEDELKHLKRDATALEAKLTAAQGRVSADHDDLEKKRHAMKKKTDKTSKKEETNNEKIEKSKVGAQAQSATGMSSDAEAVIARVNFWAMNRSQRKSTVMHTLVYIVCGILVALLFQQARSRYPTVFLPLKRADVYACQKDFSFSIFGFLGDKHMCILGCCCPCLAWADNLDRKDLLSFWKAFAAFFGLLLLHAYTMGVSSLFVVVIGVVFRQRLRVAYDMESGTPRSVGMDALVWCFCQPCAIIQEAREVGVVRNMVTAERVKAMEDP